MTTSVRMAAGLIALLCAACPEPNPLLERPAGMELPADVEAACRLTQRRCTRCHTIDRVLNVGPSDDATWRAYVHRMRLMPGSNIPPADEPTIVRCLTARLGREAP